MCDPGLAIAVKELGSNSILVLKNIEAIPMRSTGKKKHKSSSRGENEYGTLTYSGVLNVLDGAFAHSNGLITIMTTNRKDILDAEYMKRTVNALLRPGRCDMRIEIATPTEEQIKMAVVRTFSPHYSQQEVEEAAEIFLNILKDHERKYNERVAAAEKAAEKAAEEAAAEEVSGGEKVGEESEENKEDASGKQSLKRSTIDILLRKRTSEKLPSIMEDDSSFSSSSPSLPLSPPSSKVWHSFVGMKHIQDYCRKRKRKHSNPLEQFLNVKRIYKWLKEFHENEKHSCMAKMDDNMRVLKIAATEVETKGPGNDEKKIHRAKILGNALYIVSNAISMKTNIASIQDAQKNDKIFFNILIQYEKLVNRLQIGKKKLPVKARCIAEDPKDETKKCCSLLMAYDEMPAEIDHIQCQVCEKSPADFDSGGAAQSWGYCKTGCQEWYCEKDYEKIIETQRQKDENKKEAKEKERKESTTESNEEVEKKEGEENDADGADDDDDDNNKIEKEENDDLLQEEWEAKQLGVTTTSDDIMNIKMSTMQTQLNRIEALLTNKNYRKKEEAKCRWKKLQENVKIVTQIMRESKEEEDKKE
jgi:hypothetical protein